MSAQRKSKKVKVREFLEPNVGQVYEELEAPITSEIVFRKKWTIRNFYRTISKREFVDSPDFRCSVNGVTTYWNMSIRFWKGPDGKKVTNPLVLCLNLTGCKTEETGQARVRYQFGTWDASIRHWECNSISNVVVYLENKHELHSVGYETLKICDRHLNINKDLSIMVKIQVIRSEEEIRSLSQDLTRVLTLDSSEFTDTIIKCAGEKSHIKAHSFLIKTRSPILARKLSKFNDETNEDINYSLDLRDLNHEVVQELLRYLYSDKVDNAEMHAIKLLPLSIRFDLPGLTSLCERVLAESFTPENVVSILLLADQCGCEILRKAALVYCEQSEDIRSSIQVETPSWAVECHHSRLFDKILEQYASYSEVIKPKPKKSTDRRDSLRYQRQNG